MRRGGVLVTASRTAREQAERRGIAIIETALEDAIMAGRKSRWTLTGERLGGNLRHVVLDSRTGAIVVKRDRTAGGRRRYFVLRLIALGRRGQRGAARAT